MPDASLSTPATPAPSYEAAVQELESLISRLESGQMPLQELLGAYQRANELLTYCRAQLQAVEDQIRIIDGERSRPWEPGT